MYLQCEPDYATVQKMEYLDMVVRETLRLQTPGVRYCTVEKPRGPTLFKIAINRHVTRTNLFYFAAFEKVAK